jgi:hypothetical protein
MPMTTRRVETIIRVPDIAVRPSKVKRISMQEKLPAIAVIITTSAAMMTAFAPTVGGGNEADRPRYLPEVTKTGDLILPMNGLESARTAEVIAAQLHRQGVSCSAPRSAVKDAKNSVADVIVWTLRCDEGAYSVRLIPHIGARITPIR